MAKHKRSRKGTGEHLMSNEALRDYLIRTGVITHPATQHAPAQQGQSTGQREPSTKDPTP